MLEKVTDMKRIRLLWPFIRQGLGIVSQHSPDNWIPEDVFMALSTGAAFLHISTQEGTMAGFVVLTFSQGYSGRECHVWCAYNTGPSGGLKGEDAGVAEIAAQEGCKFLTFFSPRPGWERLAPELGWEKVHTLYRKEVGI